MRREEEKGKREDGRETREKKQKTLFFPYKKKKLTLKNNSTNSKGAELPVEEVPFWQSRIVQGCRKRGKPVIVATNMLESMIQNPTPTRAEVSDISIAVREGADAVMLSGRDGVRELPAQGRVGDEDGGDEDGEGDAGVCGDGKLGERGNYCFFLRCILFSREVSRKQIAHPVSFFKLFLELQHHHHHHHHHHHDQHHQQRRYGSEEAAPIDWIVPPTRASTAGASPARPTPSFGKTAAARGGGRAAAAAGPPSPSSSVNSLLLPGSPAPGLSEMFAYHATTMANTIRTAWSSSRGRGTCPSCSRTTGPTSPSMPSSRTPPSSASWPCTRG